jgi:T5SS/PEP-CTERM-associated repeat protein
VKVTHGASVSGGYPWSIIHGDSDSAGVVTVDGSGSTWTGNSSLYVDGILNVTGGGGVAVLYGANSVSIYGDRSLLAIDVGRGSLLDIGDGTITNDGTVRIFAGAGVAADGTNCAPISAGTWGGTGTYQAVGGTWSTSSHKFTASSVIAGMSSVPVSLDRNVVQRVLINDNGTGGTNWQLGASFLAAGTTSNMVFTATAVSGTALDALRTTVGIGNPVLDAWTFSTTGYTLDANDPIYFSLKVGPGHSTDDLELWGYDGTSWAAYVPSDLTYDGTYASFTATGLSGFAAVPEPGTLAFLAVGFLGLLAFARRIGRVRRELDG